jgi:D-aminoacyl-tRNA deacylase
MPAERYFFFCRCGVLPVRAVVQRVSSASVIVDGEIVGEIDQGLLVLLGVGVEDADTDAVTLAEKIAGLRVFEDINGKMNLSLKEVDGRLLVVSQFTLFGDCRKGRRPSFIEAARPEKAEALYESFVAEVRGQGISVETGKFQAHMDVRLVNDGPVTLLLDSHKTF